MTLIGQIERTGRKRRQKRLILVLATVGALGLGGLVMFALAQTGNAASRSAPTAAEADASALGPVTAEEADQATSEAEALQVLVSTLGEAVVEAGIRDMSAFESLLTQTVQVVSAADEMGQSAALGAEDAARGARAVYRAAVRDSRAALETVRQQLTAAGVDVEPLLRATE